MNWLSWFNYCSIFFITKQQNNQAAMMAVRLSRFSQHPIPENCPASRTKNKGLRFCGRVFSGKCK